MPSEVPKTSLDLMQEIHHRVPEVEIRDEHLAALDALAQSEKPEEDGRALIVMASGLGKTTVMAAHARRRLLQDPSRRALFLNDNNDILGQARNRFEQIVGEEFTYGPFNGDGRDYSELSVLFGSFQVMRDWHPAFLRDEFDFGMVDESHHSSAETYKPTLDYFDFKHLSGFTATPDRMDIHDIRDIFGPERFNLPLERAIARRMLAPVEYWLIGDEIAETGFGTDSMGDEYTFAELDKVVFDPRRDEEIVRITQQHAERLPGVKRIVFCRTKEHAERVATYYPNAIAYHSGMNRRTRRETLEKFKDGDIDTLTSVDVFNEGVDVPSVNQIVMLRETGSKRIFLQQLGRGLRKTPGKKKVQVLDFAGNCDHLFMVDRVWKDIASEAGINPNDDEGLLEINLNSIHFNESALRILPLLRRISSKVYNPEQVVDAGSIRLSSLARELNMTPAALKTVASTLKIVPDIFPTQAGGEIPYFSLEDAERLTKAVDTLFS